VLEGGAGTFREREGERERAEGAWIRIKMKKIRISDFGFRIWPPKTCPRPSTLPAPRWNDCPLTRGDLGFRKAESGNCEEALALDLLLTANG